MLSLIIHPVNIMRRWKPNQLWYNFQSSSKMKRSMMRLRINQLRMYHLFPRLKILWRMLKDFVMAIRVRLAGANDLEAGCHTPQDRLDYLYPFRIVDWHAKRSFVKVKHRINVFVIFLFWKGALFSSVYGSGIFMLLAKETCILLQGMFFIRIMLIIKETIIVRCQNGLLSQTFRVYNPSSVWKNNRWDTQ